jgi:hypothetical protein
VKIGANDSPVPQLYGIIVVVLIYIAQWFKQNCTDCFGTKFSELQKHFGGLISQ